MGPPSEMDPPTHRTMSGRSTTELHIAPHTKGVLPPGLETEERVIATVVFCEGKIEGNILFNDALNTFYLQLYGVRHMVKDHSDSERGNPLPPRATLSD